VFRIFRLKEWQIWGIGDFYVTAPRKKEILARADIAVERVVNIGLNVEAAEPPPCHANIANWPFEKHSMKSLAQELAANAILRIRTSNKMQ
jgi:hypothetical protein